MRGRERKRVDRFKAAMTFVEKNPTLFAKAPPSHMAQVQALRDAVAKIEQGSADCGSGKEAQMAEQRRALREVLRVKHLAPLRRVAQVVGRTTAGVPKLVPVPKSAASLQQLLSVASAVVSDLAPHQEAIVQCGFPEDFLAQLQQAIDAVSQSHSTHVTARQRRLHGVGEWQMGMQAARDAVRCLDVVVRRVCDEMGASEGDGPLSAWNSIVPPARRGDRRVNTLVSSEMA